MGVRRFEDLVAWQLSRDLQNEVFALIAQPAVSRDAKFCDQVRESARSSTRNIAEGFGRYYPREFVRFLRIATASLHETKNHLHDAYERHYLSESEHNRLERLTLRAIKATTRLAAYLLKAEAPDPRHGS